MEQETQTYVQLILERIEERLAPLRQAYGFNESTVVEDAEAMGGGAVQAFGRYWELMLLRNYIGGLEK